MEYISQHKNKSLFKIFYSYFYSHIKIDRKHARANLPNSHLFTRFDQIHWLGCLFSFYLFFFPGLSQNISIVLWANLFEEYLKSKYNILETSIVMPQKSKPL